MVALGWIVALSLVAFFVPPAAVLIASRKFLGRGLPAYDVVLNRGGGVFRWGGCAIGW